MSFHYVTICLSYFLLSHSIYLSVYFSPSPLFSQLTPHPFHPNPFNHSTPSSPLKSVRKARASLCFFFVVQSVGLLDTSVRKIVSCERINRHYLHSCRFFRQLFRRFATNVPGLCFLGALHYCMAYILYISLYPTIYCDYCNRPQLSNYCSNL